MLSNWIQLGAVLAQVLHKLYSNDSPGEQGKFGVTVSVVFSITDIFWFQTWMLKFDELLINFNLYQVIIDNIAALILYYSDFIWDFLVELLIL